MELMKIVIDDPSLEGYNQAIRQRYQRFVDTKKKFEEVEGSIEQFARGFTTFGMHLTSRGLIYKEWAPNAVGLSFFGDFNNWNRDQFWGEKDEYGCWTVFVPSTERLPKHGEKVKAQVVFANGEHKDKLPAWATYVIQNKENYQMECIFWNPPEPYEWVNPQIPPAVGLKIYEAHVGMSAEDGSVNSYRNFADHVIPKIAETGYNAIQLMAIMEHPYYGSFGYHVTSFYAISSRCGTPEDLKYLIDTAHGYRMTVLIDLIHSHASSNTNDGISFFDGSDHQYFHGGKRGIHHQWDSRVFNYASWEVIRFLLSNITWYLEEYRFDGIRFDGITSMLYTHHGIGYCFSGGYHEYFNNTDDDAILYLMLANDLVHSLNPHAITIAEEVSGMPGLCRPIQEGGFGFDYRLNMSVPDQWIKLLKEIPDENWNIGNIVYNLVNRRWNEKHVAYSESHDQSIVGDKTIAMWLFDREIYYNMSKERPITPVVHRGMALHKMIRLITMALGGEAYLCFMGNEFGHPEWVDFPREGNGFSHHHCRRQWSLRDNPELLYNHLWQFDQAMLELEEKYRWLNSRYQYITLQHEDDKVIVFERGTLLFVLNFHPNKSFEHYRVGTKWPYEHVILLDSDEARFYGNDSLRHGHQNVFPIMKEHWQGRPNYIQLYIPSRTAIVLKALEGDEERAQFGLPSLKEISDNQREEEKKKVELKEEEKEAKDEEEKEAKDEEETKTEEYKSDYFDLRLVDLKDSSEKSTEEPLVN